MHMCCLAVDIINADASATEECEKTKGAVDQSTFEWICFCLLCA